MIILWLFYDLFMIPTLPTPPPHQTNRVQYASHACKKKDVRGPAFPLS